MSQGRRKDQGQETLCSFFSSSLAIALKANNYINLFSRDLGTKTAPEKQSGKFVKDARALGRPMDEH